VRLTEKCHPEALFGANCEKFLWRATAITLKASLISMATFSLALTAVNLLGVQLCPNDPMSGRDRGFFIASIECSQVCYLLIIVFYSTLSKPSSVATRRLQVKTTGIRTLAVFS